MRTLLLTGFEPFGVESINPAWESVRQLDARTISGFRIVGRMIPTSFGRSVAALESLRKQFQPEIVIAVGQAGGRPDLALECVAININDARIPDNDGAQPKYSTIVEEGPAAYWTSLPVPSMLAALHQAGIPANSSYSAGTFVCNHVYYSLMHHIAMEQSNVIGGFIHVPYIPEQAANHPGVASMSLDQIVLGLEIAIVTVINNK
jgi:pyroglutamyl-peptidase